MSQNLWRSSLPPAVVFCSMHRLPPFLVAACVFRFHISVYGCVCGGDHCIVWPRLLWPWLNGCCCTCCPPWLSNLRPPPSCGCGVFWRFFVSASLMVTLSCYLSFFHSSPRASLLQSSIYSICVSLVLVALDNSEKYFSYSHTPTLTVTLPVSVPPQSPPHLSLSGVMVPTVV